MPTVKREGLPEFWVTGLAKILVGDQPCRLQAWIKGHFKIQRRHDEDAALLARYKIDHTDQLTAAVKQFNEDGWTCRVEQWVKLRGHSACISGKPDIIRTKEGERPTITDIKTGAPRDSDLVQVQIYQVIWGSPTMRFAGQVFYSDRRVLWSNPEQADALKPRLFALVRELATKTRPPASPSMTNCRFCDVSETDCPDRWREKTPSIVDTTAF